MLKYQAITGTELSREICRDFNIKAIRWRVSDVFPVYFYCVFWLFGHFTIKWMQEPVLAMMAELC
jgi:hypothetical protein